MNAPLNIGLVRLIIAILLMVAMLAVTWFLIRAKHLRSTALLQKEHKKTSKKTTKAETMQVSNHQKRKLPIPVDRKQELLEQLLLLDQEYEVGKLSEAVYQERRSKTKEQLRSLMEV